jgi:hypothetical protein
MMYRPLIPLNRFWLGLGSIGLTSVLVQIVLLQTLAMESRAVGQEPKMEMLTPAGVIQEVEEELIIGIAQRVPINYAGAVMAVFLPERGKIPIARIVPIEKWTPAKAEPVVSEQSLEQASQAVDSIENACELSPQQHRKLLLAVRLEQHYLQRRIQNLIADFDGVAISRGNSVAFSRQLDDLRIATTQAPEDAPRVLAIMRTLLTAEQQKLLYQSYLQGFMRAAARAAVLDAEQEDVLYQELLQAAAGIEPVGPRRDYVQAVLNNLSLESLTESLDEARCLAVKRFTNYFTQQH